MKGKATVFGLCAVLAAGMALAEAPVEMKPGLWEVRIIKMEQDGQDVLTTMQAQARQAMAHLSPEQRKQFGGDPTVSRVCFSPAMTKGDWLTSQNARNPNCAPPKVSRDGNRATFETTCQEGGGTMVSKGEAVSAGDQITIKSETVMTAASGKHTMINETRMKFVGADCGDVKPMDEMVKQMRSGAAKPQGKPGK